MQTTFLDVNVLYSFDDLKPGDRFVYHDRRYERVPSARHEGFNVRDLGTKELWVFGTGITVRKIPANKRLHAT